MDSYLLLIVVYCVCVDLLAAPYFLQIFICILESHSNDSVTNYVIIWLI